MVNNWEHWNIEALEHTEILRKRRETQLRKNRVRIAQKVVRIGLETISKISKFNKSFQTLNMKHLQSRNLIQREFTAVHGGQCTYSWF